MKTAIDIVLELVEERKINAFDAKILLKEMNKPPQVVTVPYNTGPITTPDWTYDPNRAGSPWYTTSVGTTSDITNTNTTTSDNTNG